MNVANQFQIRGEDRKYLLVVISMFFGLIFYISAFHYQIPYFDGWDFVRFLRNQSQGRFELSQFFDSHGAHWHATGYMVMQLLAKLSSYSQFAEVIFGFLAASLSFAIASSLAIECAKSCGIKNSEWAMLALCAFMVFSIDQAANWLWGWQLAVHMNILGFLVCVYYLSRPVITAVRILIACFAAGVSIYSFATGLLLLPIALLILFTHPNSTRRTISLLTWTIFSVFILWHLKMNLFSETGSSYLTNIGITSTYSSEKVGAILVYSGNFLSGAMVRFSKDWAVFTTPLGILVALASSYLLISSKVGVVKKIAPILAFILYACGAGLLAAIGRVHFGTDHGFVYRYVTFANFFWLGTLVLIYICINAESDQAPIRPRVSKVLAGAFVLLILLKVTNQFDLGKRGMREARKVNAVATKLCAEYTEGHAIDLSLVANPEQKIEPLLQFLHTNRLSAFRDCNDNSATRLLIYSEPLSE